jgi:sec-independent protein translocase protein TatA
MLEGLFQPMHLLIILGICLLIFGPKKLPELGKGLGDGIRGFKDAMANKETTPPPPAAPPSESKDNKDNPDKPA